MSKTNHETARSETLRQYAATCAERLAAIDSELAELDRLAAAHGKRRGDRRTGGNDTQKYRLGSMFAVLASDLDQLDDLAILGLLSDGELALRLLALAASKHQGSLVDLIRQVLSDPSILQAFRRKGARLWWDWNRALYHAEVEAFAQSDAARDPRASWRRRPPSRRQLYLIDEAVRAFELDPPTITNRGQAYEWLRQVGGNPRFSTHSTERKI